MKFNRPAAENEDDLNITPMIDIVFQLLIFFMVGTTFTVPEKKIVTELPKQGATAQTVPEEKKDIEMVKIFLKTELTGIQITCNGRLLGHSFNALGVMLKELAEVEQEVPVIIDATPNTPFKYVVRAMDMSKRARLTQIAFSAGAVPENLKKPDN